MNPGMAIDASRDGDRWTAVHREGLQSTERDCSPQRGTAVHRDRGTAVRREGLQSAERDSVHREGLLNYQTNLMSLVSPSHGK